VGVRVPDTTTRPTGPGVAVRGRRTRRLSWSVLAAISLGGILGALGRYALTTAWRPEPARFPWSTFVVNVSGCLLIGVVMVLITEVWSAHRLLRPFLGVGVLGGYTTFSTYAVDGQRLVAGGAPGTALVYLVGTPAAALAAVYIGVALTRVATRTGRAGRGRRREDR
jgi:fluoride exporter